MENADLRRMVNDMTEALTRDAAERAERMEGVFRPSTRASSTR